MMSIMIVGMLYIQYFNIFLFVIQDSSDVMISRIIEINYKIT